MNKVEMDTKTPNTRGDFGHDKTIGRRQFMTTSVLIGAALTIGPLLPGAAHAQQTQPLKIKGAVTMKQRNLGTMEVSELGAGCMTSAPTTDPPRR